MTKKTSNMDYSQMNIGIEFMIKKNLTVREGIDRILNHMSLFGNKKILLTSRLTLSPLPLYPTRIFQ